MNKIATIFISAVASVAALIPGAAQADSGRSFTIVNRNSSVSIQRVWYARAGSTETWITANMNYAVAPDSSSDFTFGSGYSCFYDIKIEFSDGYTQTFNNLNTCRGDRALAS